MRLPLMIVLAVLLLVAWLCVKTKKLSVPAAFTAVAVGFLTFMGAGYAGICLLGAFFILGTLATSHKKELKAKLHAEGLHQQTRNAGQVLANGGVAALLSILAIADPAHAATYLIMLAGGLASAASDTLSSELGVVYARNHYNILTFRKEQAGPDGVISLEGTLLGLAGALAIALVYAFFKGFSSAVLFITLAGVMGNLLDSVLGASLERKHYIGNDAVNFFNTLFAALVALLLSLTTST
jgi:uncharacterized protein (TIGR00297 family)